MQNDVIVIGAGAAGLAAARTLHDAGRQVVTLEARERIGGRVWTDYTFSTAPVECGAEFIHGGQVGTWAWLRRAGLRAVPFETWRGRRVALGDGRLAGAWLFLLRPDLWRVQSLEAQLTTYDGPDCSLAQWLAAHRYSPLARHVAYVRLAHSNCATSAEISVAELAHDAQYGDQGNYHVVEGYDRVLTFLAAGLDIRLQTPITTVRWSDDAVEVETNAGCFNARAAVVTLPLALLKAGAVRFEPALPEAKQQAMRVLSMRPAVKVLLRFAEPFWDRSLTFLIDDDPLPVWWTVRPGAPVLVGFATGPNAARLGALGAENVIDLGLSRLTALFGAAPCRLFSAGRVVDWGADPWSCGGYSSVPVGAHGQRAVLAASTGALHFAGEATVTDDNPATVHGALGSGERAAREVLATTR
jgi:monoamine oxidase